MLRKIRSFDILVVIQFTYIKNLRGYVMRLYKNIYDSDFLEKFNSKRKEIEQIELIDNKIDVDKIAGILGLRINYSDIEHSGKISNKEILVNEYESKNRQRFTIAHEIGHFIFDHGESLRTIHEEQYKNIIEKTNEIVANNFAANLLMPKNLVLELLVDNLKKLGYDVTEEFDNDVEKKLVQSVADTLNVSSQALSYQIDNLDLFTRE